ncbi:MAG: hypothetical protein ACTSRW_09040 [Candidatus Helarchaeota archaeon]
MSGATDEGAESEIRFLINDINAFKHFLMSKKALPGERYRFTDHCYRPRNPESKWTPKDLETKTMRIREWHEPLKESKLLFSKVEIFIKDDMSFKKSIFPNGKLEIITGDISLLKLILKDWDFEFWFKIHKEEGQLFRIPHSKNPFNIALEKIEGFGYSAEIEVHVKEISKIEDQFKQHFTFFQEIMDTFQVTYRSLPSLVAEKLGL